MAGLLNLHVVTAERTVVDAEAEEVTLPGAMGYLGILPGHTALITLLTSGVLSYKKAGAGEAFALDGGLAEISNDVVRVLAGVAERSSEIDAASAERDLAEASEGMKHAGRETLDDLRARAGLASARIAVTRGAKY
ncbi:MAG TPA: ATP synthase F1 subunit epsilon [Thermoanaerobaculia bacterium]|nr:ATP synthase F1 subunit epsilon [Thermoanaerobaculia bacterium]